MQTSTPITFCDRGRAHAPLKEEILAAVKACMGVRPACAARRLSL